MRLKRPVSRTSQKLRLGRPVSPGLPPAVDVEGAIRRFGRMTTREVEVLCGLPGPRASAELFRLAQEWRLRPLRRPTGYLWEAAEGP